MAARVSLPLLDAQIEARCRSVRDAHPYWPCAEGCDHCCRSLPHLPEFTADEWARLRDALAALPDAIREDIQRRTRAEQAHPVSCPLLDTERGRTFLIRFCASATRSRLACFPNTNVP